jgi:hypothetical protein
VGLAPRGERAGGGFADAGNALFPSFEVLESAFVAFGNADQSANILAVGFDGCDQGGDTAVVFLAAFEEFVDVGVQRFDIDVLYLLALSERFEHAFDAVEAGFGSVGFAHVLHSHYRHIKVVR